MLEIILLYELLFWLLMFIWYIWTNNSHKWCRVLKNLCVCLMISGFPRFSRSVYVLLLREVPPCQCSLGYPEYLGSRCAERRHVGFTEKQDCWESLNHASFILFFWHYTIFLRINHRVKFSSVSKTLKSLCSVEQESWSILIIFWEEYMLCRF